MTKHKILPESLLRGKHFAFSTSKLSRSNRCPTNDMKENNDSGQSVHISPVESEHNEIEKSPHSVTSHEQSVGKSSSLLETGSGAAKPSHVSHTSVTESIDIVVENPSIMPIGSKELPTDGNIAAVNEQGRCCHSRNRKKRFAFQ